MKKIHEFMPYAVSPSTSNPGSVHAIIGPSGYGKTTLLYILGLLDRADSGTLMIDHHREMKSFSGDSDS